jgi:hypothetical protein
LPLIHTLASHPHSFLSYIVFLIMAWPPALNTAIDLYNTDKHEECITHIRTVLRDNTPNYARVRYYTLLACCLDDWYEVGVCRPVMKPSFLPTNIEV